MSNRMATLVSRYSGLIGAFAFSGSNFLLAFALMRWASPQDFGIYALLQVMLQFGISLSNALFCSPVVVVMAGGVDRESLRSFLKANVLFSTSGAIVVATAVLALSKDQGLAVAAGALCFLSWLRWFLRSAELALCNFGAPAKADIAYALVVGLPAIWLLMKGAQDAELAVWLQTGGCVAAFLTLGRATLGEIVRLARAPLDPFLCSLRRHGRWAILGVITTEATANAHAWIAGFFLGPAVFAPIAAMALFFRPVLILTQSLTQYERPKMAKAIRSGKTDELMLHRLTFTRLSLACLVANGLVVAGILIWMPELIGNGQYPAVELWWLAGVILLTYLARVMRGAESAELQAGGNFRPLALVTVYTAPVAILGVALATLVDARISALLLSGVLVAEIMTCALIRRDHFRLITLAGGRS